MADFVDAKPVLKQATFDAAVKDAQDEGMTLAEASEDVYESLEETFDTSGLFYYQDEKELELKNKFEEIIKTSEACVAGTGSFVNVSFGLQTFTQTLNDGTSGKDEDKVILLKLLKMMKQRKYTETLIKMMVGEVVEEDDDDDDSDEDKEEDNRIQLEQVLTFSLLLMNALKSELGNESLTGYYTFENEELLTHFMTCLDAFSDNKDIAILALTLLIDILPIADNKSYYTDMNGFMNTMKKLHKKSNDIKSMSDIIIGMY